MKKSKHVINGVEFNFNTYQLLVLGELIGDDRVDEIFKYLSSGTATMMINLIISSTAEFYENQGRERLDKKGACALFDQIGFDGMTELFKVMQGANEVKEAKKKAVKKATA